MRSTTWPRATAGRSTSRAATHWPRSRGFDVDQRGGDLRRDPANRGEPDHHGDGYRHLVDHRHEQRDRGRPDGGDASRSRCPLRRASASRFPSRSRPAISSTTRPPAMAAPCISRAAIRRRRYRRMLSSQRHGDVQRDLQDTGEPDDHRHRHRERRDHRQRRHLGGGDDSHARHLGVPAARPGARGGCRPDSSARRPFERVDAPTSRLGGAVARLPPRRLSVRRRRLEG